MSIWKTLPKPFFALAPMDDVTDTVFRQVIAELSKPDLFFTEFVNVDGLQSPGREKLLPKLQFTDNERPIIAQTWGRLPANYAKTAYELVKMGFVGIDINMGCPDRAVIKNGCCAALIDNKELAGEIIRATREGAERAARELDLPHRFPISVKTRLGNRQLDMTWPEYLLQQDLDALIVHGRLAKDMSKYPADWGKIGEIRQIRDRLSPDTLIIGNGDVKGRQHGLKLAQQYGLDGVMIGRGIFDDPYVFSEHSTWSNTSAAEKLDLYRRHVELFTKTWQPGQRKIYTLNKFCKIYVNGFPRAKDMRQKLMSASSTDELLELLSVFSSPRRHSLDDRRQVAAL